mmetsp:Transcript_61269/g.154651  ORF Transcript_61269/g.154651 Transcript_61269/m.154651 type:complete len:375 (+) Transcript_61269:145-1269(+)
MVKKALEPLKGVLDVKVSVPDRCAYVEHRTTVNPDEMLRVLNAQHLGAILKSSGEAGEEDSAARHEERVAALKLVGQVLFLSIGFYLELTGRKNLASDGVLLLCVLLSYSLFHKAFLAILRRQSNVELLMSVAMLGSLLQAEILDAAMVGVMVALLDMVTASTIAFIDKRLKGCISVPSVNVYLADDRMIKVSFLTENVRHLQPKQAKRTLENSLAKYESMKEAEVTEEKKLHGIRDNAKKVEMRIETMMEDMEYMAQRMQYYDRMQANGDPEYDFHFGGEGRSATEASQEAISHAVTDLSQEVCGLFVDNLKRIEGWQDAFERQQNELHGLVAEMQIMVRQQAWCVAAMAEAVDQLGAEEAADAIAQGAEAAG